MNNPKWKNRTDDDLAGSPELFTTNLLLMRAIENATDAVEIKNQSDQITVQFHDTERDSQPETLTEASSAWKNIRKRLEHFTEWDSVDSQTGQLKPNIPTADTVTSMDVAFTDDTIQINFNYSDESSDEDNTDSTSFKKAQ